MRNFRRKNAKKVPVILASLVLSGVMASGTMLTAFADIEHTDATTASQSKGGIFYTDYSTPAALEEAAKALAEEINEEGMVLMQNNNNALPLAKGSKVSVFGKSSVNPAYGGGGSGALIGVEPVSLFDGLKNAGFKTNGVLEAFYNNNTLSGTGRSDKTYVNETPVKSYTRAVTESYRAYDDAAIIVITRTGAEGSDLPRTGNVNDNVYDEDGELVDVTRYLSVTPAEIDLVEHARENFSKVIVLVNSSNTVELGAIKDKVDSILWVGNPGEVGFNSVGKILSGEVNPSGRLSDTYVCDLTMDPTWSNFGNNSQNAYVSYIKRSGAGTEASPYTYALATTQYNAIHEVGTVPADNTQKVTIQKGNYDFDGNIATANKEVSIAGLKCYESGGTYTEYEEGIYVGYRYYETRAYEIAAADTDGEGEAGLDWYDDTVDFAYGTGLSYTTFKWELKTDSNLGTLTKNGKIRVKVDVTNTGSYAGKEVVQLYYSAPYYAGGIEKSFVNLGAFAKTELLQPGDTQTITLEMDVQDMASFDWNDANGNGFKGYELEEGNYNFFVGTGSHCWADMATEEDEGTNTKMLSAYVEADSNDSNFKTAATENMGSNGLTYTTDKNTGNDIKLLFSNDDIYNSNLKQTENKLQRSTFATASTDKNIIETENTADEMALSDKGWALISSTSHLFSIEDDAGTHYAYEGEEHAPWYKTTADTTGWTQYSGTEEDRPDPTYTFADMAGVPYDDPKWDTLLNELTWKELTDLVYVSGFTNAKIDYIGKLMAIDDDGPMQVKLDQSPLAGTNDDFTGSGWPCSVLVASTWNVELAEEQGVMLGNECLYLGISGWFAPAMNLHRNQYGGRIFEYYSSDPFHSGKIAAAVTRGVQSKGVYAYLKHFCLNNQDTGRGSISIVVNEQAMRELYMSSFEIAVEEGGAHGLMTYYSFVGGTSIMQNYAILTDLVRNQWGFQGIINHDYGPESYTSNICTPALTRRVGNGVGGNGATYDRYPDQAYYDAETNMVYYCLDSSGKVVEGAGVASPTHWWAMRESAKQLLWTTANSSNQKNKLSLDMFSGTDLTAKQDVALSGVSVGVDNTEFGTANVTYELHSGSLPEGITLNTYTGELTGTTLETGTFEFEVRMRADFWITKTETYTLTINPTVTVSSGTAMETGKDFYGTIEAESFEGATEVTYTLAGGALPEGITLNSATGEIEGTAVNPGTYEATIHVHGVVVTTNSRGQEVRTDKDIDVNITFTVTGKTATESALEAANGKIEQLETSLGSATTDLGTANGKIDQLQSDLNSANEKIADLEKANEEGGCNGSLESSLAMIGGVLVLGAALVVIKVAKNRKKND